MARSIGAKRTAPLGPAQGLLRPQLSRESALLLIPLLELGTAWHRANGFTPGSSSLPIGSLAVALKEKARQARPRFEFDTFRPLTAGIGVKKLGS